MKSFRMAKSKTEREIENYAACDDVRALLWLLSKYHWESEWAFVAKCSFRRYGMQSYQTHRVWEPTRAGRVLYAHRDELQ